MQVSTSTAATTIRSCDSDSGAHRRRTRASRSALLGVDIAHARSRPPPRPAPPRGARTLRVLPLSATRPPFYQSEFGRSAGRASRPSRGAPASPWPMAAPSGALPGRASTQKESCSAAPAPHLAQDGIAVAEVPRPRRAPTCHLLDSIGSPPTLAPSWGRCGRASGLVHVPVRPRTAVRRRPPACMRVCAVVCAGVVLVSEQQCQVYNTFNNKVM